MNYKLMITSTADLNTINRLISTLRRKMYKIESLKVNNLLNSVNANVYLEIYIDASQNIQLVINQLKKIVGVKEILIID